MDTERLQLRVREFASIALDTFAGRSVSPAAKAVWDIVAYKSALDIVALVEVWPPGNGRGYAPAPMWVATKCKSVSCSECRNTAY